MTEETKKFLDRFAEFILTFYEKELCEFIKERAETIDGKDIKNCNDPEKEIQPFGNENGDC